MTRRPADFREAGPPRRSGLFRRLGRPLGPLAIPIAGRRFLPLYAIIRHTGRSSGQAYATPVVALPTPDGFLIPLPFGDATQWARNLFASGSGGLRRAGREYDIGDPRVIGREEAAAYMPAALRILADRFGLRQYVRVRNLGRR